MNKKRSEGLIYHSLHGKDVRGCLPVFVLLAFVFGIGLFFLFKINRPVDVTPKGKGQVYLKKDPLFDTQIARVSPLVFGLPEFADPAMPQHSYSALPVSRYAGLESAPPIEAFSSTPLQSPLFEADYLLALPADIQAPWTKKELEKEEETQTTSAP